MAGFTENNKKQLKHDKQWKPGQSGNPGGRPRAVADVQALAREHTEAAIKELVNVMSHAAKEEARTRAAEILLHRGYGAPSKVVSFEVPSPDERLAALEAKLIEMALAGDSRALEMALKALAPEKYGKGEENKDEGNMATLIALLSRKEEK